MFHLSSGPHVDAWNPWQVTLLLELIDLLNLRIACRPMSQISNIFGTDDDSEIVTALYTIANVGHLSPACDDFD